MACVHTGVRYFNPSLIILGIIVILLMIALAGRLVAAERYDVVLSFSSVCCGPDEGGGAGVEELIRRFEREHGTKLEVRLEHWGLEGERDYCINLRDIPFARRGEFITAAKDIVTRSRWARLGLNAECPLDLYR